MLHRRVHGLSLPLPSPLHPRHPTLCGHLRTRTRAQAVELEREFCCDALSVALVGMNAELMSRYIEFVADRLLVVLGYPKLYNVANPFDWMDMISLQCVLGVGVGVVPGPALSSCALPPAPPLPRRRAGARPTFSSAAWASTSVRA